MTAATLTLADFLLGRIAEDEASIDDMIRYGDHSWWSADRMLAECEAKRRIVQRELDSVTGMTYRRQFVLRDLAAVYADHPDYRDEWRP